MLGFGQSTWIGLGFGTSTCNSLSNHECNIHGLEVDCPGVAQVVRATSWHEIDVMESVSARTLKTGRARQVLFPL